MFDQHLDKIDSNDNKRPQNKQKVQEMIRMSIKD